MRPPKLKRSMGLWMATALVVGNMIGSGVFLLPASLADTTGARKRAAEAGEDERQQDRAGAGAAVPAACPAPIERGDLT